MARSENVPAYGGRSNHTIYSQKAGTSNAARGLGFHFEKKSSFLEHFCFISAHTHIPDELIQIHGRRIYFNFEVILPNWHKPDSTITSVE